MPLAVAFGSEKFKVQNYFVIGFSAQWFFP